MFDALFDFEVEGRVPFDSAEPFALLMARGSAQDDKLIFFRSDLLADILAKK
jgi:hypothetical protein